MNIRKGSVSIAIVCLIFGASTEVLAGNVKPPPADRQFTREEFMVLNLNRGADSSGSHINDSLKEVKQIARDLDKSLRQVQQVDREFAKSKGKPDDRFLNASADRIEQALKSAQQLIQDLEGCKEELKENIHNALIMGQ